MRHAAGLGRNVEGSGAIAPNVPSGDNACAASEHACSIDLVFITSHTIGWLRPASPQSNPPHAACCAREKGGARCAAFRFHAMPNKMLIDASHPEETRVVVVRGQKVEEFDFESASRRPLRGNIYLAKVTRVEPSLQAAFVEYGGNRHGFLAFSEIHPDYYQIPVADRQALLAEQASYEDDAEADAEPRERGAERNGERSGERGRGRRRRRGGKDGGRDGSREKRANTDETVSAALDENGEPVPRDEDNGEFAPAQRDMAEGGDDQQQRSDDGQDEDNRRGRSDDTDGRDDEGRDEASEDGGDDNGDEGSRDERPAPETMVAATRSTTCQNARVTRAAGNTRFRKSSSVARSCSSRSSRRSAATRALP
jgi:Ribonuclease G/E